MPDTIRIPLLPILFALVMLLFSCGGESVEDIRGHAVDRIFARYDNTDSPGCACAVIRDGEIVYSHGYGMASLEQNSPITPRTVFYIASVSKQFVAMSIQLLTEEGRISLDDNIREYVPEIPDYGQTITIRHLIHHTSGLRGYLELWLAAGRDWADTMPDDVILEMLARQRGVNFAPGEAYRYCNTGYFLMGVIVERVSGMTLAEFMRERIFEPLGMNDTHLHDDRTLVVRNRAQGHFQREDGTFGLFTTAFDAVGSGGVHTTVEDLARWDANFYDNRLGKGSPALIDAMYERGTLASGDTLDYASALVHGEYRGRKTIGHGGSSLGFKAQILRFPGDRFSVVVLSNLNTVDPGVLARRVADVWLFGDEHHTVEREISGEIVSDALLRDLPGRYRRENGTIIRIVEDSGSLYLRDAWPRRLPLSALDDSTVFESAGGITITLQRNGDGKADGIDITSSGQSQFTAASPVRVLDKSFADACTGSYYSDELDARLRLTLGDGCMVGDVWRDSDIILYYEGEGRFAVDLRFQVHPIPEGYFTVDIVRDDKGTVTGLTMHSNGVADAAFVKED